MRHRTFPLAFLAVSACASAGTRAGGPVCEAASGVLSAGSDVNVMPGRYVVTMIATAGERRGESVSGYMTLRAAPAGTPGPAPNARTAVIGTTDIALARVGAMRLGDTWSEDPRAPGVAVYEQRPASGAPTVTMRLGSATTAAPTPGMTQIEGQYTVFFVRRIERGGFAGGWQSGSGDPATEARGHFCATRVE
jgi:hypothetical protein